MGYYLSPHRGMGLVDVLLSTAYLMARGVQHDATNRPPSGTPAQLSFSMSFLRVFCICGFAEMMVTRNARLALFKLVLCCQRSTNTLNH